MKRVNVYTIVYGALGVLIGLAIGVGYGMFVDLSTIDSDAMRLVTRIQVIVICVAIFGITGMIFGVCREIILSQQEWYLQTGATNQSFRRNDRPTTDTGQPDPAIDAEFWRIVSSIK